MAKKKANIWETKFDQIESLGEGGNAEVFHVRCKESGENFALKCLYNKSEEKKCRFFDEIKIMNDNYLDIEGIIPIINFSEEELWYTMPIARSIMQHINDSKLQTGKIILGIIQLTDTLSELHFKGISHRDIKPSNIYYYEKRFYFGDFGLVEFPDNLHDFTRSDKGLGAIFTIAPEMKRNPKQADGKKADVFSLAKTMWMLLTGDERGFDGPYNFLDRSHSLRFMDKFKEVHLVGIEELLAVSTDNDPNNRPNIHEFRERLCQWIETSADFEKSQIKDWEFLNKYLFGDNPPDSTSWRSTDKIINVLNIIGTLPAYNHMLFSDGGGLDFGNAELANENNCIYIYDSIGYCFLAKPRCLYYEGFGEKYEWNYFLLEFDELTPIFERNSTRNYEFVVEDYPAHYVSAEYEQYGVYDYDSGEPLPENCKSVRRYLRGKFLIVLKKGPYNKISATYDGRHGDCSNNQFREYLKEIQNAIDKLAQRGITEEAVLRSNLFNENPFEVSKSFKNSAMNINRKEPREFIINNCTKWCFKELLENANNESNIHFYFSFDTSDGSLLSFSYDNELFLCKDGFLKRIDDKNADEIYYVNDREAASKLLIKCNDMLDGFCIENGYDIPEFELYFSIELKKCGKPTHLFSLQEIKEIMRNADDRHDNMLVINENGYAKIIQDVNQGHLYPVSHESWNAGNVYVGRYSNLTTLKQNYLTSLQGWLMYLECGQHIRMDYVHENINIEDLITEIKKYY